MPGRQGIATPSSSGKTSAEVVASVASHMRQIDRPRAGKMLRSYTRAVRNPGVSPPAALDVLNKEWLQAFSNAIEYAMPHTSGRSLLEPAPEWPAFVSH